MCLGIPSRIIEVDGEDAVVDVTGARRRIKINLLPDLRVGEYVIVHAGFAIERLDTEKSEETLRQIDEVSR